MSLISLYNVCRVGTMCIISKNWETKRNSQRDVTVRPTEK